MQYPSQLSGRIWLIGGTQESAHLAAAIAHANLPCTISVTTESALALYSTASSLRVWVGRLTPEKLEEFLQQQQIVAVLDASHPYAVEISNSAIAAAQKRQIPYLRYERPMLEQVGANSPAGDRRETTAPGRGGSGPPALARLGNSEPPLGIRGREGRGEQGSTLDSFETLLSGNYLQGQRVLLTVGYKSLHLFQPWHGGSTLFARILPSAIALEAASTAGFTPDRLICLRPPISADLERALWLQWEISLVVTKASGTAGGEDIKRTVAAELGIPLVVISRPTVSYPQQTSDLLSALEFCRQYVSSVSNHKA